MQIAGQPGEVLGPLLLNLARSCHPRAVGNLPQGVGSIFGALPGLCNGSRLPGAELAMACGNSFGRGPLIYHFTAAGVEALRKR
jgi:hypothetical protein